MFFINRNFELHLEYEYSLRHGQNLGNSKTQSSIETYKSLLAIEIHKLPSSIEFDKTHLSSAICANATARRLVSSINLWHKQIAFKSHSMYVFCIFLFSHKNYTSLYWWSTHYLSSFHASKFFTFSFSVAFSTYFLDNLFTLYSVLLLHLQ